MNDNIIGYKFKTNILGQQVLYVKIRTNDVCSVTLDWGPEYSFFRKANRQEAESLLRRCKK